MRLLDVFGALIMLAWRRVRPAACPTTHDRILLIQLDHLGDAVLTSPILPMLRVAYPQARIDVLASSSNRAVFEADPNVDRVHVAERNWFERRSRGWALASAVVANARKMRREGYDLGIDVRGDVLSVLLMTLACIPRRLGWAMGGGGFLLTDVADWIPGRHEVESRLALLRVIGLVQDASPRVVVHAEGRHRRRVGRLFREAWPTQTTLDVRSRVGVALPAEGLTITNSSFLTPGSSIRERVDHTDPFSTSVPLLVVHLGAGTRAKRWPIRHWNALLSRFLDEGWRIVVVGGEEDRRQSGRIICHERIRDWTGQLALCETVAVLEQADMFIGADSGPAHLAAAARLPSIVLFSGTNNPRQWRPYSRRTIVLRQRVPCRPCHRKVCPLEDHPCLSGLSPDRVFRAALRWHRRLELRGGPP